MVIELKWKKDAKTALDQIREKKYYDGLKDISGEVILVGINYEKDFGDEQKKHTCKIECITVNCRGLY